MWKSCSRKNIPAQKTEHVPKQEVQDTVCSSSNVPPHHGSVSRMDALLEKYRRNTSPRQEGCVHDEVFGIAVGQDSSRHSKT
jgi:hypothetical protein